MPQRYYSQSYEPVDNPFSAEIDEPSPGIENPFYPPSGNDRNVALEDFHSKDRTAGRSPQTAYNPLYNDQSDLKKPSRQRNGWSRRRKLIIFGGVALALIIIAIVVGVAVSLSKKSKPFNYTPSNAQVTSEAAFNSGGATHQDPSNTADGIGAGQDEYTYYSGDASQFPDSSKWISFENMWDGNYYNMMHACKYLGYKHNNSYVRPLSFVAERQCEL